MVLLVAAFAVAAALWSDRIPISGGFGWDGALYGRVAADPLGAIKRGDFDAYGVQRILPSLVVHFVLRTAGARPTPANVVAVFEGVNALLLTLGAVLWVAIARTLRLAPRLAWLGWLGLFVNFPSMRQASYYAVMTDVSAFTIGLAMLLCFLRRRPVGLAALALLGAFVWPLAVPVAVVLLAAPRTALPERDRPGGFAVTAAIGAGLATCVLTSYLYFVKGLEWQPGIPETILVGIVLATGFVAVVTLTLLHGATFRDLRSLVFEVSPRDLGLAVAAILVITLIQKALVHDPGGAYFRSMLRLLGMFAVAKPFNFFVPHVIYFGAIISLMVAAWPVVARVAREWGIGVVGVILLTIGMGLDSESRHAMLGFPFLVAATVVAVGRIGWPANANWWVAGLGLVASKIWMRMPLVDEPTTAASIARYPMQWYFLSHGPWISVSNYLIQAIPVTIVTAAAWILLRRTHAPLRTDESSAAVSSSEVS